MMLRLAELFSPIQTDLSASALIFDQELADDQDFINRLYRHVDEFHGKRLRPALLLLTADACGEVCEEHRVLAAVVEMVHIATLVHDDVLDEADMRRRTDTVNSLCGNERAVLLGDMLFSHAYHLCSSLDSQFASRVIAQTAITVCQGEMMQVAGRGNYELSEPEYFDIITRKTASLIGACSMLGARFAGAEGRIVERMREFGISIGVAFQIVDDLLDLMGDEREVGKSLGLDIEKDKLTLPLIHYLRECSGRQRAEMLTLLRADRPDRGRCITKLLAASESPEYARQTAFSHVHKALDSLDELPPSDSRDSLRAMAEFILARKY